ncbi:MAG: PilZ domain-containing protein [Spirochaetia bacterium]
MNVIGDIIENMFRRSLDTNPIETALFLFIIFGFFGLLVLLYHVNKKKERKRLAQIREEKWERLCRKYNISDRERNFLEELAQHLEMPEKKYLLMVDYNTFHYTLQEYSKEERPDADLVTGIIKKTGMKKAEKVITEIPVQRRKSARISVNIPALLVPAEGKADPLEARIFDLSKGGCRTTNPEGRFAAGDDVKISFTYKEKKYNKIPAAVVRTSGKKKVLHLSFGHVKKRG